MKLLTVCIPTYKRPETLRKCIESVSKRIEKYSLADVVNIYVANDASPDNTIDILNKFESLEYFNSVTREVNLGMNVNIKNMLNEVNEKSKYQLIITDDDYLQPDILNEIVEFLRNQNDINNIHAIWTPRYSYTEDNELHAVVCNSLGKSQLVKPAASNVGKYMNNGFILSGLILQSKFIDFEFWDEYKENAYFPIIFFGELIFRSGAYYWDENIVHHTVLNECHWESWGKTDVLIHLRLFSDYVNAYGVMAKKISNIFKIVTFYIFVFPSIRDLLQSFMLSANAELGKHVLFQAVRELKRGGYLIFNIPLAIMLLISVPVIISTSFLKILITRIQLLLCRNDPEQKYHKRISHNYKLLKVSSLMISFVWNLIFK